MFVWLWIFVYFAIGIRLSWRYYNSVHPPNDVTGTYGYLLTGILYLSNSLVYLSIPFSLFSILGILRYNPVFKSKKGQISTSGVPFVLFRVVTRGLYPHLVHSVTRQNLDVCQQVGLGNFKFEIVTDRSLNLPRSHYLREIVVPESYKTKNGTLFKARALHYCLDQSVNILSGDDWIVHLDEETLLTERALFGIVDFISKAEADIGQGVITYGKCEIENWLTTLLDGVRTAVDYGLFRMALQMFKRPVFGFKGSYIVVRMNVEESVGFDFGPSESIAEDLRFALTAWSYGYKFDFIEGEMKEKSTFTLSDFIKQRKRWFIGHFNILWSTSVSLYFKLGIFPMHISNMLMWANIVPGISPFFFQIPLPLWHRTLVAILTVCILFMFAFGNFMSLSNERFSWRFRLSISLLAQLLLPVSFVLETYAALRGMYERHRVAFDLVQKEVTWLSAKSSILNV